MLRAAAVLVLFSSTGLVHAQTGQCGALLAPAVKAQQTVVVPVTAEFSTPARQLGAPSGVLAQALGESLSVEQVLFRMQVESCGSLASIAPVPSPGSLPSAAVPVVEGTATTTIDPTDPAVYQPRTEFDNTPWRFDMNQNGERMTADAFAAWMESKGVRVAKGRAKQAAEDVPVEGTEGDDAVPAAEPATAPAAGESPVVDD